MFNDFTIWKAFKEKGVLAEMKYYLHALLVSYSAFMNNNTKCVCFI